MVVKNCYLSCAVDSLVQSDFCDLPLTSKINEAGKNTFKISHWCQFLKRLIYQPIDQILLQSKSLGFASKECNRCHD